MKRGTKSEWFILDSPLGESEMKWKSGQKYQIERFVDEKGIVIWFGLETNWKKRLDGQWTVLSVDENSKPLEKYLPDIVYGEGRTYFKPCDPPIYEIFYQNLYDG